MAHSILLLLLLLWPFSALAQEPGLLRLEGADHYSLAPHFRYLEDAEGKLTPDDLLGPSLRNSFRRPSGHDVNFGYSRSVFWLRAGLKNESRKAERYFLEIAYPTLDRVTVYLIAPDGSRTAAEAGDLQPFALRPYPHHNLVFPLSLPPGESLLLIRVESEGSLTVPATLWQQAAFDRHSIDEYAVLSFYFGILGALFLYNLMLFLSLREPVYLAYIGFVASMAVGQLSQCGLGNEFFWPSFTAWGNIAFPVGFAAVGFFGALFSRLFLDTRRTAPRLDRVIMVLAACFAFTVFSPAFLSYRATAMLTSFFGLSFSAVVVATGVVCLLNRNHGARYFLLAWTMLLLGAGMLSMRNFAWVPTTFVTSYGMQIGSALEMLLLSFALADRINHMRGEKDAAQQNALLISNEKEKELASKAREWEDTFNSISDMVLILDRDYRIRKANRAAADFLGSPPQELIGRQCRPLHHQDFHQPESCPCRDTFGQGKTAVRELYEPKFGRHLEITTSPIFDGSGAVAAAVHIAKDISWRKKLEEEMIRTEKLDSVSMLAGGIAHDFNNMLTIIMSTTTLAKMYAKDDARVVAKIDEAEQEIIRTRELTNQLLTFAKGGAPVRRLASFEDLLRDTVEFSVKGSNVLCDLAIAADLWAAEIDNTQISQVFSNLVINAVQSMHKGGTVRVRADNSVLDARDGLPLVPGRYVRIVFEDSGVGISENNLSKIFDPFFTTKTGGSGLGLSISYSIVKKHGGYIDVKSQPGAGSAFTVYLPASFETPEDSPPPAVIADLNGGGRVLFMDDEEKLLNTVAEMLTNSGYDVETARNGEEAIILYKRSLVQARPFDAVVLDVTVAGGMGGRDCIQRLRELDPRVRAIVVSGYSEDAVLADYRKYGFREALTKPFSIDEIKTKLQSVIAGTEGSDAPDPRR